MGAVPARNVGHHRDPHLTHTAAGHIANQLYALLTTGAPEGTRTPNLLIRSVGPGGSGGPRLESGPPAGAGHRPPRAGRPPGGTTGAGWSGDPGGRGDPPH